VEPRIEYAKTKDDVSIAFWTLGRGLPFVQMPGEITHIQMEWQSPEMSHLYERLAEKKQLVRYDRRGSGLSERDVVDCSLDAQLLDLEAVVDRLELERFALFGGQHAGPVAIAYAARHPDRVSHLLLWCSFARGSDFWRSPRAQAFRAIRVTDWEMYAESIVDLASGLRLSEEERRAGIAFIREATTPESHRAYMEATQGVDVNDLLSKVKPPTLVLHRREVAYLEVRLARELASRIPDARLIDEFLGEGEEPAAATELPEGMAVLLFADIAESTALTEQLGDAAFRARARELDTSLRAVINEAGGTPVEGKVLGDGVLAVFTSARQAIDCALRCEAASQPLGLQLHLGIHAGDVIREGNNVYGGAVNIAARIAAASEPGEVLVSDVLRGLARTSAGVTFDDRGEHTLKGVGEPQRLFAVRGGGAS
jgi:class 3 adenylate cyclase